ncbi:MAG: hypothetical protein IKJ45_02890 [Kiritimatiellae bacterium]|nr:hypothetical protein [Kiritimatiellia bacterium]
MKRLIGLFLFFIVFCLTASADVLTTEKRNAFEFCDLYTIRLYELKDRYGIDATHDISDTFLYNAADYLNYWNEENQYTCNVPAGTIKVSVPEFEIEHASCSIMNLNGEDSENKIDFFRAIMMYAALEYDGFEDYKYSSLSKLDSTLPQSVMAVALDEFSEAIDACFDDSKTVDSLLAGDHTRIPLLSGNYDYYLYSYIGERDGTPLEYIYVEAVAK